MLRSKYLPFWLHIYWIPYSTLSNKFESLNKDLQHVDINPARMSGQFLKRFLICTIHFTGTCIESYKSPCLDRLSRMNKQSGETTRTLHGRYNDVTMTLQGRLHALLYVVHFNFLYVKQSHKSRQTTLV